ncbi:MAG: hypothetical protein AAF219_04965 [Myxococcota bacterium]
MINDLALDPSTGLQMTPEEIRSRYIRFETELGGYGLLNLLFGASAMLYAFGGFAYVVKEHFEHYDFGFTLAGALAFAIVFAIGALSWVAGCDLTNGSGRSRVTATVFWAPLLLAFPVGTKLAFWPLYMVHSERGHFVTSEEYHQVCAETPEMKRLSFIGLIIGVPLGLGLLFFLFSQFVSHFL